MGRPRWAEVQTRMSPVADDRMADLAWSLATAHPCTDRRDLRWRRTERKSYSGSCVLLGRLARQVDAEGGAPIRRGRLEDEVAVHRPAQLARDVEPQAAAVVRRPLGPALEPPEQAGPVGLASRRPVVGDRQPDRVGSCRDRVRRDLDVDRRPPPYFTALSRSAHRTWSSWSGRRRRASRRTGRRR